MGATEDGVGANEDGVGKRISDWVPIFAMKKAILHLDDIRVVFFLQLFATKKQESFQNSRSRSEKRRLSISLGNALRRFFRPSPRTTSRTSTLEYVLRKEAQRYKKQQRETLGPLSAYFCRI